MSGCVGDSDQPEWAVPSTTLRPTTTSAPTRTAPTSTLPADDADPDDTTSTPTTFLAPPSTLPAAPSPSTAATTTFTATRPAGPVPLPSEPGLAPVVSRVPTSDRVIFLTIDDGIWRVPGALEKLHELGIPFTSFLTLPYAREDRAYWTGSLELGGRIESHTTNHPDLKKVSPSRTILEVCSTRQPFVEMFGQSQQLFRPPYGSVTEMVRRAAAGCDFRAVVLWKGTLNNGVLALQDGHLTPGDIILMHYRPQAFADIQAVVLTAAAQGFKFGLLEDYLVGPAPETPPAG